MVLRDGVVEDEKVAEMCLCAIAHRPFFSILATAFGEKIGGIVNRRRGKIEIDSCLDV